MHRTTLLPALLLAATTLGVAPAPAHAQAGAPAATPPAGIARPATDSIYRRARRLVLDGNGPAGRALVDSLLAAAPAGSPQYGDALYWHGALAPTAAEAERDYRRVIVEFPLAYYADDALLAIAELEQARGDRASALAHLQRFVKEHPASPARSIAALGAARLAFEQRDTPVACAMIAEARASVASDDVEIRNQIAHYGSRCPATAPAVAARMGTVPTRSATPVDTQTTATRTGVPRVIPDPLPLPPRSTAPAAAAARDSVRTAAAPPRDTARPVAAAPVVTPPARVATAQPSAPAPRGRFTVQLAAFNTRAEAERSAAAFAARGLQTRVSGTVKPFRVRLGFHATRAAAAAEAAGLKARGIVGFVAEEAP